MKKLQNKNKTETKNRYGVRKSELIGLQALLLQQKMNENASENSAESPSNFSFSEKKEIKEKRESNVNDLINSKPVTKKRKKTKMFFLGESI